MRATVNTVHVEGYFYEADMALKTVQRKDSPNFGTEFYNGYISIATDEECTNIIRVYFTYVTAVTKQGKASPTFTNLKNLLENGNMVTAVGKENAAKVSIDTSFAENNYWSARNNETVSQVRLEGGFVNVVQTLKSEEERATFEADVLVNSVNRIVSENDDEPDKVEIRGAVFDFRKSIVPVNFISYTGADFFEDLASDGAPHFLRTLGILDFMNITIKTEEEGAFGGPIVKTRTTRKRDFVITNANPAEYDVSEEEGADLTIEEVKKALQDREVRLADVKKNYDEYQATKESTPAFNTTPASTTNIKKNDFKF